MQTTSSVLSNCIHAQYSVTSRRYLQPLLAALLIGLLTANDSAWASQRRSIAAGAMANTISSPGETAETPAAKEGAEEKETEWVFRPYTEGEQQGIGCLVLGTVTTGITSFVNTNEYLMIAAGGTMAPTTPMVAVLALFSTIYASGCAVGAIAAPTFMRWYKDAERYVHSHDLFPFDWNFLNIKFLRSHTQSSAQLPVVQEPSP